MLTKERKEEILNRNFDGLKPYIQRIFIEAPNLENSVHIEGVALCWKALQERSKRKIPIQSAIRKYEKEWESDRKFVGKMTGEELPPLNTEDWLPKPKYVVNEDLTSAVLENVKSEISFNKKVSEFGGDILAAFVDDLDNDRFYGTVVNEDTLKKLHRANELLDIIKTNRDVNVKKFKEPNPRSSIGVVAVHAIRGMSVISGTAYKAFRELVQIADDCSILPATSDKARISFGFHNLWKESREMTDAELAEENDFTDEDLEEIDNEIEKFNKGEFDYD